MVVARRPDGTWSPPSNFVVSTVGGGFMIGLDVHECVCVLNTAKQVRSFAHPRVSLGGEASIAVGPVGTGGSVGAAVGKTARPVWSYMKSRGLWAGVQVDGTVIITRADANAVFYNQKDITARRILYGNLEWPTAAKPLHDLLQALEVHRDFDPAVVEGISLEPPRNEHVPAYDGQQHGVADTNGQGSHETAEEEKRGSRDWDTERLGS